jgi:hypothetical protein
MKISFAARVWMLGAAVAGTMVGPQASREAAAAWRNMHVSSCRVISGTAFYNSEGQLGNTSTTASVVVACPFDGDSRVPSWNTNQATVTLSGWSAASNGLVANVCTTWSAGGGGACSPTPTSSVGQGVRQMSLSTIVLADHESADFPYLTVTLGPMSGGSGNAIWGYVMGTP